MASMADRRSIGQEVVFRVQTTGTGVKVIRYDGEGLREGVMSKRTLRYFYGDDAEQTATDYAYRKRDRMAEARDCPVTVVELGEVVREVLAEKHDGDDDSEGGDARGE